jgi:hypothetical protein
MSMIFTPGKLNRFPRGLCFLTPIFRYERCQSKTLFSHSLSLGNIVISKFEIIRVNPLKKGKTSKILIECKYYKSILSPGCQS